MDKLNKIENARVNSKTKVKICRKYNDAEDAF